MALRPRAFRRHRELRAATGDDDTGDASTMREADGKMERGTGSLEQQVLNRLRQGEKPAEPRGMSESTGVRCRRPQAGERPGAGVGCEGGGLGAERGDEAPPAGLNKGRERHSDERDTREMAQEPPRGPAQHAVHSTSTGHRSLAQQQEATRGNCQTLGGAPPACWGLQPAPRSLGGAGDARTHRSSRLLCWLSLAAASCSRRRTWL